jgi:predicted TIM-barrel fold metal-dependent hydrolase
MTHQGGLIDVHAHFTTERCITEATAAGHLEPDGTPEDYWPYWSASRHLDLMDQAGIDRAILSMSSPGVHFGDDAAARVLAREVNEAGAWIRQQHPDRFGQFAALPLPDADGALVEIAYALDDLGADGVIILSNSGGRYLGDSHLSPVLAELDQRRAVIFLHPTSCVGHEHVSCGRPRPMIEFLFDTARTVVDFILSGAAERFPNLQLIVPTTPGPAKPRSYKRSNASRADSPPTDQPGDTSPPTTPSNSSIGGRVTSRLVSGTDQGAGDR